MKNLINKYLPYIQELMLVPEVADFATEVYNKALLLNEDKITLEEFDDGIYLEFEESIHGIDAVNLSKRSINWIKSRIAKCS